QWPLSAAMPAEPAGRRTSLACFLRALADWRWAGDASAVISSKPPRVYELMAGSLESRLRVTRQQILAFRRRVGALDERMPMGSQSLRRAAWAGLQDSMPRAALLSLHARVEGVEASTWEDPSLAQLWGPRYHTYVVAKRDFALFSLGRL